jgi:general secretion pathway protein N
MAILRKPEYFWPALWVGIAAALVVVIALEYQFGAVTVGDGQRAPAKVIEAKLLPAFALTPETQSAPETVGRPLFVPTRRPAPAAATAAVQTMKRGQFVLTGVTVTPELSFAFLKEVANGKTLRKSLP